MDYYLSFGRFTGPRHFQIFKNVAPSLAIFGTSAAIYFLYISDWKELLLTIRLCHLKKMYPFERSINYKHTLVIAVVLGVVLWSMVIVVASSGGRKEGAKKE
ncbi:unnamed protein product [Adineta ricciae]|uniref:Uncharacterized protein n=1 Tax=Adineta ricciae TaxID=249248 RepID=A0A813PUV6_ADIRI|nr:unnamed protein product [Adineta ricciae]